MRTALGSYRRVSVIQRLLEIQETQRPYDGPMLLGTAIPQDPRAACVLIREEPLYANYPATEEFPGDFFSWKWCSASSEISGADILGPFRVQLNHQHLMTEETFIDTGLSRS